VKLITLNLPETWVEKLDQLVKEEMYPSRAEAIRMAIRDLLKAERKLYPSSVAFTLEKG